MNRHRRALLGAGLGLGAGAALASPASARVAPPSPASMATGRSASEFGVIPNTDADQTRLIQLAIDRTTADGQPLLLPPGRYRTGLLELPHGTVILGAAGSSILSNSKPAPVLAARGSRHIYLDGLTIEGIATQARAGDYALIEFADVQRATLTSLTIRRSSGDGVRLYRSTGTVAFCTITDAAGAALVSNGGRGLDISHNTIADCADNGILVWQEQRGPDGTIVTANQIARIGARSGGSGQFGNGINVFRADGVVVNANRITDCAFSAVRGNSASNIQIVANSCSGLGEVAIYAEFGFTGAAIANNIVARAATGIAVTNLDHGGRLAVISGNLIRDLHLRPSEPVDKRGDGITVEADASVTGNVIENAPNFGLMIGWGAYMRSIAATGNVIRNAGVGIAISNHIDAGHALIAQNLIASARLGAIRAFDHGKLVGEDLGVSELSGRVAISGNLIG